VSEGGSFVHISGRLLTITDRGYRQILNRVQADILVELNFGAERHYLK